MERVQRAKPKAKAKPRKPSEFVYHARPANAAVVASAARPQRLPYHCGRATKISSMRPLALDRLPGSRDSAIRVVDVFALDDEFDSVAFTLTVYDGTLALTLSARDAERFANALYDGVDGQPTRLTLRSY